MRVKKWCFIITLTLTVASLIVYLCPLPALFERTYDIALAVFGSSLLACILSIIEYSDSRREDMNAFYREAEDCMALILKCTYYSDSDNPNLAAANWLRVFEHGIQRLKTCMDSLDFLFGNRTVRRRARAEIYEPLLHAYRFIGKRERYLRTNYQETKVKALKELNQEFFDVTMDPPDSAPVFPRATFEMIALKDKWANIKGSFTSFSNEINSRNNTDNF